MNNSNLSSINQDISNTHTRPIITALTMFALFIAAMDSTIVSALIPIIKSQFNDSVLYPWLITGFILSSILITPIIGTLADRIGERNTIIIALSLFFLGSIFIWYAPSIQFLIIARVIQGIGAGSIIVTAYVIVGRLYNDAERGKMQSILSLVWGLAAISGPLIGAIILQTYGWRAVFLLNVPISIAIITLIIIFYPKTTIKNQNLKFNFTNIVSFGLLLLSFMLLIMSYSLNFSTITNLVLLILIILNLVLQYFLVKKNPNSSLIPLVFLKKIKYITPSLLTVFASITLYSTVTLLPIYLHEKVGLTPITTGFYIMMAALGWVFGSAFSGSLLNKISFKTLSIIGSVFLIIGCLILVFMNSYNPFLISTSQILIGLGIGFCATSALVLVQNQAPFDKIGVYTSAIQLCRNLGAVIGINLVTAIQISTLLIFNKQGLTNAFDLSFSFSFIMMLILSILSLLIAFLIPRNAIK